MTHSTTIQTLTKAEALKALDEGKKIAHRTFDKWEYIEKYSDMYYRDEAGYVLKIETFWKYRSSKWFMADWFIVETKND
jgi:hypothetical protein